METQPNPQNRPPLRSHTDYLCCILAFMIGDALLAMSVGAFADTISDKTVTFDRTLKYGQLGITLGFLAGFVVAATALLKDQGYICKVRCCRKLLCCPDQTATNENTDIPGATAMVMHRNPAYWRRFQVIRTPANPATNATP